MSTSKTVAAFHVNPKWVQRGKTETEILEVKYRDIKAKMFLAKMRGEVLSEDDYRMALGLRRSIHAIKANIDIWKPGAAAKSPGKDGET